ncbi:hypothetical protein B0H66DRAFT_587758 [Apodospora peruviana]|uniref:Uncharacterized protein n=1 Tax=Apodospora peruviana TaxID=516989 RepID=A0AAE0IH08_9PEZI|nr:hypothetical protein B0H66DRAFT_587758 [Apodospora peruviana]
MPVTAPVGWCLHNQLSRREGNVCHEEQLWLMRFLTSSSSGQRSLAVHPVILFICWGEPTPDSALPIGKQQVYLTRVTSMANSGSALVSVARALPRTVSNTRTWLSMAVGQRGDASEAYVVHQTPSLPPFLFQVSHHQDPGLEPEPANTIQSTPESVLHTTADRFALCRIPRPVQSSSQDELPEWLQRPGWQQLWKQLCIQHLKGSASSASILPQRSGRPRKPSARSYRTRVQLPLANGNSPPKRYCIIPSSSSANILPRRSGKTRPKQSTARIHGGSRFDIRIGISAYGTIRPCLSNADTPNRSVSTTQLHSKSGTFALSAG